MVYERTMKGLSLLANEPKHQGALCVEHPISTETKLGYLEKNGSARASRVWPKTESQNWQQFSHFAVTMLFPLAPKAQAEPELKAWEASRRTQLSSKLDSLRLGFNSFKLLLTNGIDETHRAHRICLGVATAHGMLAQSFPVEEGKETIASLQKSSQLVGELHKGNYKAALAIDKKILSLADDTHQEWNELESKGKAILDEMNQIETQVREAWGTYSMIH